MEVQDGRKDDLGLGKLAVGTGTSKSDSKSSNVTTNTSYQPGKCPLNDLSLCLKRSSRPYSTCEPKSRLLGGSILPPYLPCRRHHHFQKFQRCTAQLDHALFWSESMFRLLRNCHNLSPPRTGFDHHLQVDKVPTVFTVDVAPTTNHGAW